MTLVRFHPSLSPLMESIAAVQQHPDNANNGDVDLVAQSMEINGVYAPIQAQRSTGNIVAGNTRYAALLSLGQHRIPVVWLDIDDTEALRILLADNRTSRVAMMDHLAEGELLEHLNAESELGLLGSGYTENDLEWLRGLAMDPETPEMDDHAKEGLAKQRGQAITCPSCGHTFGGGK